MKNKVSVVIPSTGRSVANINRLLNSIYAQNIVGGTVEILLVLNGKNTAAAEDLRSQLSIGPVELKFKHFDKAGVNLARNLGLWQAVGDIVVFLDDDCELATPFFLQTHQREHEQRPEVFALGGGYQLSVQAGYWDEVYNRLQMRWLYTGQKYLLGGNFSLKAGMARREGLSFDESIAYGGSEVGFFRQAALKSLSVLIIELDVWHHTRESLKTLTTKIYKQGRGKKIVDLKYGVVNDSTKTQDAALSLSEKLLYTYLNYVFWAGFYSGRGQSLRFIQHLGKDLIKQLNYYRFWLLDKFNR